jgi:hypothetical protein
MVQLDVVRLWLGKLSSRPRLMAVLELGELTHEGSGYIGIDLAVKKDWPVGLSKLRGELVQVLRRADGRSLKTEAICDWRKIHVWEHRFSHGLLPEPQKMQLCAIGAVVHQHYHYRQVLSHYRLELSHRHQEASVADNQHCGFVWPGLCYPESSTEAKANRGEVADHLETARIGNAQVWHNPEEIAAVHHDVAVLR